MASLTSLTRIKVTKAGGAPEATVKIDVGKTFALMLLAIALGTIAAYLYVNNQGEAAGAFVGFVGLILGAGFGLSQGEKNGAAETLGQLRSGSQAANPFLKVWLNQASTLKQEC